MQHTTRYVKSERAVCMRSCLMDLPKIRTVVSDPSQRDGDRLILLRMSGQGYVIIVV